MLSRHRGDMWPHCKQRWMIQQQHHQRCLSILGFVAFLQKVAKKFSDLEEELDFTLCTNITRSGQVLIITCLHIEHLSWALPFLYVSKRIHHYIHVINTLWCSTYFSPSSQLKYFLQGCATSGILSITCTHMFYNHNYF